MYKSFPTFFKSSLSLSQALSRVAVVGCLTIGMGTVQGQVSFRLPQNLSILERPADVTQGDIDGDGDLDLVTVNSFNSVTFIGSISILKNNGNGTFQAAQTIPFAVSTFTEVDLGDIDRDGDLDLVAISSGVIPLKFAKNNGDGTFSALQDIISTVGGPRAGLALGDVDGDGDLDLVTGRGLANLVEIYKNNGDGTFVLDGQVAGGRATNLAGFQDIALLDSNGDGDLDIVGVKTNEVNLFPNDGTGRFSGEVNPRGPFFNTYSVPGTEVEVGDIDGDGDIDIVTANYYTSIVTILRNNGDGVFTVASTATAAYRPRELVLVDFDKDGDLDIATVDGTTSSSNTVSILSGNGNGTFAASQNFALGGGGVNLAVGDLDGDGDPDLGAALLNFSSVAVLINTSLQGLLQSNQGFSNPFFGNIGTFFADVDGDGLADSLAVNSGSTTVRRSNGINFGSYEVWSLDFFGTRGTFFADVNNDARADAIVVNDSNITVRRSDGIRFGGNEFWTLDSFSGTRGTYVADVDGDGRADIIAVNDTNILVRRSTGVIFGPTETWSATPYFGNQNISFADVTGDGLADAIAVNDAGTSVRRSTGTVFGSTELWTTTSFFGTRDTFFADLDGNGLADAIAVNDTNTGVRLSTGVAFGNTFTLTNNPYFGTRGNFFADVTGDGKADALVINDEGITVRFTP